jgi:hypothetical protein
LVTPPRTFRSDELGPGPVVLHLFLDGILLLWREGIEDCVSLVMQMKHVGSGVLLTEGAFDQGMRLQLGACVLESSFADLTLEIADHSWGM